MKDATSVAATLVSIPSDASAETLRPYAPSDAPTLAMALGRAIVREMSAITTTAPTDADPFAGIATGRNDRAARFRKLDNARATLATVHATYSAKMDAYLKGIVALQEDLRASLAESCHVVGVSLPSIAESLGIAVSGDATIAELSADAKARAGIAAKLEAAKLEAKQEIETARLARETRLADLRAEKMRLDGFSEIEIEIDRKSRAAKVAAKVAAKQARK